MSVKYGCTSLLSPASEHPLQDVDSPSPIRPLHTGSTSALYNPSLPVIFYSIYINQTEIELYHYNHDRKVLMKKTFDRNVNNWRLPITDGGSWVKIKCLYWQLWWQLACAKASLHRKKISSWLGFSSWLSSDKIRFKNLSIFLTISSFRCRVDCQHTIKVCTDQCLPSIQVKIYIMKFFWVLRF